MEKFEKIYQRAAKHRGGKAALESALPKPETPAKLRKVSDDRWLSQMTKCVFQSGFSWSVVENKWPAFEETFFGFDPQRIAVMHDEEVEALLGNPAIVRNGQKISATRHNAAFVADLAREHGSAAKFFADWPSDNIAGLLDFLKVNGSRLGGATSQFFLRRMGKDSFMMSKDVVAALVRNGVIDKAPTSKKAMAQVQEAFNQWSEESGRSLSEISRTLAVSEGP